MLCINDLELLLQFRRTMSTKHKLTFLFICGFALLTDSKKCENKLAEGDSCIINVAQKSGKQIDANSRIKWTLSSGNEIFTAQREGKTLKKKIPQATIESDGSLKLQNVKLINTGKYNFEVYNIEDSLTASGEEEITVYEKALKPNVTFVCHSDENATLTCKTQMKDVSISWLIGKEQMKHENTANLDQTSTQLQDNQQYSCIVTNPVSKAQSDHIPVSCGPDLLFGLNIWLMVGVLAGGGALILLVILVLVICAVRSCKQREKQQDEEELRLRTFHTPPTEQRTKSTARGQPAPPIPQEGSLHPTPTTQTPNQTRAQPKGQVRARPPPPPQDEDEEDPPPLPRPRKKQHREKRNQEPYQPME